MSLYMCKTFRIQWGNKPSFQKLTLKLGNKNSACYFQPLVIIIIIIEIFIESLLPGLQAFPEELCI